MEKKKLLSYVQAQCTKDLMKEAKSSKIRIMTAEHCNAAFVHSLPGSIAAEMSDWASLTLFMASSISLFDASAFRLAFRFKPAARGFSLNKGALISQLIQNITNIQTQCCFTPQFAQELLYPDLLWIGHELQQLICSL